MNNLWQKQKVYLNQSKALQSINIYECVLKTNAKRVVFYKKCSGSS